MRIVIIGCGKVGVALAKTLSHEGHDLTMIDRNRAVLEQNEERLDMMVLEGNGTSVALQRQAEVPRPARVISSWMPTVKASNPTSGSNSTIRTPVRSSSMGGCCAKRM